MAGNYTKFKIVTDIGDSLLNVELQQGIKAFLDHSFLCIGAWLNSGSGAYGGDVSQLRVVSDPLYTLGQVWETRRSDFVYETGVDYSSQPVSITGVEVNGTVYGTGDIAGFSHHINYPMGRVVFNSPILTTSVVKLDYSYRYVQVYMAHNASFWREIQPNTLRDDNSQFNLSGSGEYAILKKNKIQLPAIVIETTSRSYAGFELGSEALRSRQNVLCHIITEDQWSKSQISDILSLQEGKRFFIVDTEDVINNNAFSLDYRGMLIPGRPSYPDLIDTYKWKKCAILNSEVAESEMLSSNLYSSVVTWEIEVVMGGSTL